MKGENIEGKQKDESVSVLKKGREKRLGKNMRKEKLVESKERNVSRRRRIYLKKKKHI